MIGMERGGYGYELLRPIYCLSLGIEHVYSQSSAYHSEQKHWKP